MKIPYTELTLKRISHCHFHANTLMQQRKGGANKKSTSDKWMSDVPSSLLLFDFICRGCLQCVVDDDLQQTLC